MTNKLERRFQLICLNKKYGTYEEGIRLRRAEDKGR